MGEVAFDLDAILGSAEVTKDTKTAKSKSPVLSRDDLKTVVDKMRSLRKKIDSATAEFKMEEATLLPEVEEYHVRAMKSTSAFISNIKVEGSDGTTIQIVWPDRYSKIPLDVIPQIKMIVGSDELFNSLFKQQMVITLKENIASSNETLLELMSILGGKVPDKFSDMTPQQVFAHFFVVERWYNPTTFYHEQRHQLLTDSQLKKLEGLVKSSKPTVRTK